MQGLQNDGMPLMIYDILRVYTYNIVYADTQKNAAGTPKQLASGAGTTGTSTGGAAPAATGTATGTGTGTAATSDAPTSAPAVDGGDARRKLWRIFGKPC
jgi:hypothetical protein